MSGINVWGLSAIPNDRKVASTTIFRSKPRRWWAHSSTSTSGGVGAPGRRRRGSSVFQSTFPVGGR